MAKELPNSLEVWYDATPRDVTLTKKDEIETNPPAGFEMSDDDYIREMNKRFKYTRQNIMNAGAIINARTPAIDYAGNVEGLGESRFDKRITIPEQLQDLENTRANMQSGFGKILNGAGKATVLAATTFTDGMIGTAAGILNVATQAANGDIDSWRSVANAFIDNPVSHTLQQINKASEEWMPNYQTEQERNRSWWQNMSTANFWGDTILKNMGFVIGAAYSGKVAAGALSKATKMSEAKNLFQGAVQHLDDAAHMRPSEALKALKNGTLTLDDTIKKDLLEGAKKLRKGDIVMQAVGGLAAATGEARIEAINAMDEFRESFGDLERLRMEAYVDAESELAEEHPEWFTYVRTPEGRIELQCVDDEGQVELLKKRSNIDAKFAALRENIDNNAMWVGNNTFALNLPLLTAGNIVQFGKMFVGGYDTARTTAKGVVNSALKNKPKLGKAAAKPTLESLAGSTYTLTGSKGIQRLARTAGKTFQNAFVEGQEEMNQSWISSLSKYKGKANIVTGSEFAERLYDPEGQIRSNDMLNAVIEGFHESWGNKEDWVEGVSGFFLGALGVPSISMRTKANGTKGISARIEGGVAQTIREQKLQNKVNREAVANLNKRLQSPEFMEYYLGLVGRNSAEDAMENAIATGDKAMYDKYSHMQLINDMVMFDEAGRLQDFLDMMEGLTNIELTDETISQIKKIAGDENVSKMDAETLREHIKDNVNNANNRIKDYREVSNVLKVAYGNDISTQALQEMIWTTVRMNDLNRQIDVFTEKLNPALDEYKQSVIDEANKKQAEGKEITIPTFDEESIDTLMSDGFKKYVEGKSKTEKYKVLNEQLEDLAELYDERAKYMDKLAELSDDPELVTRRIQRIINAKAKDKLNTEESRMMDELGKIEKFGDISQKRNEIGEIDNRIIEKLRKQQAKGDTMAKFILDAYDTDNQITEAINNSGREDKDALLEAWKEHIDNAKDMDDVFLKIPYDDNRYDSSTIDFLNQLIGSREEGFDSVSSEKNNGSNDSLAGHPFMRINIKKPTELYDEMGNQLKVGTYYVDYNNKHLLKAYTETGSEIGPLYRDSSATVTAEYDEFTSEATVANTTYKNLGMVNPINPVKPWESGFEDSQQKIKGKMPDYAKGEVGYTGAQTQKPEPVFDAKDYSAGSPVYDVATGRIGTVTKHTPDKITVIFGSGENKERREVTKENKNTITLVNPKPIEASPQPRNTIEEVGAAIDYDDKGTADNKSLFLRPFNVVADRVLALRSGSKIKFGITGSAAGSRIELYHGNDKVGELPTDPDIIAKYSGMQELVDKLHKQYDSLTTDEATGVRFATNENNKPLETTVRKIYTGAVKYGDKDIPLSQIPNIPAKPIFARILPNPAGKDKGIRTSEPLPENTRIQGRDSLREGGNYLLIPDGFGRMIPVRIFQRKISSQDYNLNDAAIAQTPIGKAIIQTLDELVNAWATNDNNAFKTASAIIKKQLYFAPDSKLSIKRLKNGIKLESNDGESDLIRDRGELIKALQDAKFAPLVNIKFHEEGLNYDINDIDGPNFAADAMDSDIFTANIDSYKLSEPGFNMDYFVNDDKGGHFEEAQAGVTQNDAKAPVVDDTPVTKKPETKDKNVEAFDDKNKAKEQERKRRNVESVLTVIGTEQNPDNPKPSIPKTVPESVAARGVTQALWDSWDNEMKERAMECA